ncbi:unnamed protein product [Rangifer tarandus platyrhynchus]|uniref:Uncharacterized protein n=1 Tax=Rangifer tarandus platyrhynchus TaxID=3082113 RepID=A0ABN8XWT5_RANTA|nr:unnamed protein product [Rangifer tarandus platyrhynchus]
MQTPDRNIDVFGKLGIFGARDAAQRKASPGLEEVLWSALSCSSPAPGLASRRSSRQRNGRVSLLRFSSVRVAVENSSWFSARWKGAGLGLEFMSVLLFYC